MHMAQLMPLPLTVFAPVNPDRFYLIFLVPANPGSPGHGSLPFHRIPNRRIL